MLLPDVNVWIALAFDFHESHATAKAWFERTTDTSCFCRMTQQAFLRLATNPKVFKKEALSLKEAWRVYDRIILDPRIAFATEPKNLEKSWRGYTQRQSFSPQLWNDAFLAAFARTGNFRVITFDKGFSQFKNLDCWILS
ncbi:type II toxin-antitoxin system VapC family toxin [soil metagenome]